MMNQPGTPVIVSKSRMQYRIALSFGTVRKVGWHHVINLSSLHGREFFMSQEIALIKRSKLVPSERSLYNFLDWTEENKGGKPLCS